MKLNYLLLLKGRCPQWCSCTAALGAVPAARGASAAAVAAALASAAGTAAAAVQRRAKIMGPVLDAYDNNPHSITQIAPNKINKDNEIQVKMNIHKRAKIKSNYPK